MVDQSRWIIEAVVSEANAATVGRGLVLGITDRQVPDARRVGR
jgi:hypothetical protein